MDDTQIAHAMSIDDAYRIEGTLAQGPQGVTQLVSIDGAGPFVRKVIPNGVAKRDVWAALSQCRDARLPHVESTYELPGSFVVVIDHVPGQTLAQRVERDGPLGQREAAGLLAQLCDAVEDLHRHGIVHRDITPSNVVLATDGAHLIDFGNARMTGDRATDAVPDSTARDTTTLGTFGFAPPEQFGFARTDARSDVFSLGRLLGFMLTGAYPDQAEYATLLSDDLVVTPRLRAIIDRASAFEPSRRMQSAAQLRDAILARPSAGPDAAVVSPAGPRQRPGRRPSRRRIALVAGTAAAAALVVAIVLVSVFGGFGPSAAPSATPSMDASTSDASNAGGASPQPHGGRDSSAQSGTAQSGTAQQSADNPLEIVESGWGVDDYGHVHYAYALRNTSDTEPVVLPTVKVTGKAEDGTVLFAEESGQMIAFPGQTTYIGQLVAGDAGKPATVDFAVVPKASHKASDADKPVTFDVSAVASRTDDWGGTTFTGEVTPTSEGYSFTTIRLTLVLRDVKGAIVYGDSGYVDQQGDGKAVAFSIMEQGLPEYASYEVHAQVWG